MLAGLVSPHEDHVDVAKLVAGTGAVLCRGTMIGLDRAAREVLHDDGKRLAFDLLSLNLGSRPPPLPAQGQVVYSVKPVRSLVELRRRIEQAWQSPIGDVLRVAIVGGGITGVEVAANLRALADLHRQQMQISIYNRSEPLKQLPHGAAGALLRHLRRSGIEVRWPVSVTMAGTSGIHFDDGTPDDCDVVINATGLVPPDLTRRLGLATSNDGALVVDEYLRSAGDASIFAAGDCVALGGFSLPRVGVYAVRQAPVLLANLCATLSDIPLTEFGPQRRFLSRAYVCAGAAGSTLVQGAASAVAQALDRPPVCRRLSDPSRPKTCCSTSYLDSITVIGCQASSGGCFWRERQRAIIRRDGGSSPRAASVSWNLLSASHHLLAL